jgi:hypothetical protein
MLPLPNRYFWQLTIICAWFIWKGASFRIPISVLQRPKEEDGWDMANIESKYKTLLYNRIQMIGSSDNSVLKELMRTWALTSKLENPPNAPYIPTPLSYLRQYAVNMAYITPYGTDETRTHFKRRIYDVLKHMAEVTLGPVHTQTSEKSLETDLD